MLKKILLIVLGGIVFLSPALFNGFPLVTADTGTYIISGFRNFIPVDRPVFYGYFIRHLSLKESLWIIIFVQGVLVSYLLFLVQKKFLDTTNLLLHLATCILLSYFTSVAWYTSQVMPDIFTATGILCYALYIASPIKLSTGERIFTIILLLFSILVHNSNLLTLSTITIILILAVLIKKNFRKTIRMNNFITLAISVFLCWLIKPTVNYLVEDKFSLSGSSHVFFVGRMVESGVMNRLLKQECSCVKLKTQINSGQSYIISDNSNGFVAGVYGGEIKTGAPIVSWDYIASADQKVRFIRADSLYYQIAPFESNRNCYAVQSNSDGSNNLIIEAYTGNDSQLFRIENGDYGYVSIISKSLNLCFDFGNDLHNGVPVRLSRVDDIKKCQVRLFNAEDKSLCMFQEAFPTSCIGFIWDEKSPFRKTGGFDNSRDEYNYWILKSFTDPQILLMQIRKSAEVTFQQIIRFQNGDGLLPYGKESSPGLAIKECFPYDMPQFISSKQFANWLNSTDTNARYDAVLIISLLLLLVMIYTGVQCKSETMFFVFLVILLLVLNAWVCGTFANAVDRLQARIIWCFPYVVFLLFVSDQRIQQVISKRLPTQQNPKNAL